MLYTFLCTTWLNLMHASLYTLVWNFFYIKFYDNTMDVWWRFINVQLFSSFWLEKFLKCRDPDACFEKWREFYNEKAVFLGNISNSFQLKPLCMLQTSPAVRKVWYHPLAPSSSNITDTRTSCMTKSQNQKQKKI